MESPTHEELLEQAKELKAFTEGVIAHLEEFLKKKQAADVDGTTPVQE